MSVGGTGAVEVRGCFEDAVDLVAYRAAEKGVELAYLHGEALPYKLMGDAARLRQDPPGIRPGRGGQDDRLGRERLLRL